MFPETSWTLIAAATLHGDCEGRSALENLCARYYLPVRSFIIWNGRHAGEADDHTQAFFLHLCEKAIMQRADKERGKFRTFMISVLKNFLSHHDRANATQKRGGGILVMALDEVEDPPDEALEGHDVRFDRAWALAVMNTALDRVAEEIITSRGEDALKTLSLFLSTQQPTPTYETAASVMGMTVAAVKVDVMRWRRRLGELVRAEIGRTVSAPHEVEEEFAYLRQLLTT